MYNRNTFLWVAIVAAGIFCVVLSATFFLHLKSIERQFREEEAVLSKNNQNVGKEIESVKIDLMQNEEALAVLEGEKNILEEKARFLKDETEKLAERHTAEIEKLKAENAPLAEKILKLENQPLTERLKNAIDSENNENIRKILEKTLNNLESTNSTEGAEEKPADTGGKAYSLWGGTENEGPGKADSSATKVETPVMGRVLLLDRRHNIAVINLGRRDNVTEGQACVFLKDDQDIASGKIISMRYNVSACFVDELAYQRTLKDIEKGSRVLILE